MSLAVTNLTSGHTQGASIGSFVTASVSPSANALLVLGAAGFDGSGSQDFTITGVSGLGLTWTRQKLGVAGSTPKGDVEAWTAVCGASPGSGTITGTLSLSNVNGGVAWCVDQATGEDTTTPVVAGNIVSSNNSSAASSVTYGTAASASNLFWFLSAVLIGTGQAVTQAPSESPAWTQLATAQSDTTSQNGVNVATQASPDVTHLTGSSSWTSSHSWGTIGLEIAIASSPAFSGTGTASLSLAATETATSARSGTRTASLAFAATAAVVPKKSGSPVTALTLAATETAVSARTASVSAPLHLVATAATSSARSGTGVARLSLAASSASAPPPFAPGGGGRAAHGRGQGRGRGERDKPQEVPPPPLPTWTRTSPHDMELVRTVPWGYV